MIISGNRVLEIVPADVDEALKVARESNPEVENLL